MSSKKVYNTVWEVEHFEPDQRLASYGQPVGVNTPIMLKHCETCQHLASANFEYKNDFGTEYEVNVHSYTQANKGQKLAQESTGKVNAVLAGKTHLDENGWSILTRSSDDGQ